MNFPHKNLNLRLFKNLRDAIVVSISNCLTSVFAGFVVFAFLGFLAHTTSQSIDQVIQQGNFKAFLLF